MQTSRTTYMPQLDSLRAIAVFAVFCGHFSFIPSYLTRFIHFGRLGVALFFLLSGFLITQILLKEREFKDQNHTSSFSHFRIFYSRRALRIFPIYYLTLFVLALLHYPEVTEHLWVHLAYASNFGMCLMQLSFDRVSHLWSLCVEEQFYLVWPFVILFIPFKKIPYLIVGLILLGPIYKVAGSLYGISWIPLTRNPLGCIETLAGGALLACYRQMKLQKNEDYLKKWGFRLGWPLLIGLQIIRGTRFYSTESYQIIYVTLLDITCALAFLPLLILASNGIKGFWGHILNSSVLRYIGKISYGIYLYHLPLNPVLKQLLPKVGIAPPLPGLTLLLIHFTVVVGIASLSWFLIEKPLITFKRNIPYPSRRR